MADDLFKIYVEQLREGVVEEIAESFPSDFLDVHEKDLRFEGPVDIKGQAYLADEMLVLHIDIRTAATIPCLVCNEPVPVVVEIKGFYHAVPLSEIKGGVYSFRDILRETILLETPQLAECREGACPQRKTLQKYFKKEPLPGDRNPDDEGYKPFAGLDLGPLTKKPGP